MYELRKNSLKIKTREETSIINFTDEERADLLKDVFTNKAPFDQLDESERKKLILDLQNAV